MLTVDKIVDALEAKCKGASGSLEVEVALLQTAVEGLKETQALQRQVDQLQEQMSMKPSVARKLAEKIKKLEDELEVTRDASRVKELERKVQKLELDLKQSYSTKNFTLKQGLLDLEKKYRGHIYGNSDMEELWHEVMWLLVEDKDKVGPDGQPITRSLTTARKPRKPELGADGGSGTIEEEEVEHSSENNLANMEFVPLGFGRVGYAINYIEESKQREAYLRELAAKEADERHAYRRRYIFNISNVGYLDMVGQHASAAAPGEKGALPPPQTQGWTDERLEEMRAAQQAYINISSALDALRGVFEGDGTPEHPGMGDSARSELDALDGCVHRLLDFWSQLLAAANQEDAPVQGTGKKWRRAVVPGSPEAAQLAGKAAEVLAQVRQLQERYGSDPELGKQFDDLNLFVGDLKLKWEAAGIQVEEPPAPVATLDVPGGRTKELVDYFMSFMQSKGYQVAGAGGKGPSPGSLADLFKQFEQYVADNGGAGLLAGGPGKLAANGSAVGIADLEPEPVRPATPVKERVAVAEVVPPSPRVEAAELAEIKAIAAKHADHAAALQEMLARVAQQHTQAVERSDDLDVRLQLSEKETALLREELDRTTKLLIEVKMAYAERDDEAQRLAARLKRSLQDEKAALDEVEELRRQLAIVVEEQIALDAEYEQAMMQAMDVIDKGADVLPPEKLAVAATTAAKGDTNTLTTAAGTAPPPVPKKSKSKKKKLPPRPITAAEVQAASMALTNPSGMSDAVSGRFSALPVVTAAGVIQDILVERSSTLARNSEVLEKTTSSILGRPSMAGSVAGSEAPGPFRRASTQIRSPPIGGLPPGIPLSESGSETPSSTTRQVSAAGLPGGEVTPQSQLQRLGTPPQAVSSFRVEAAGESGEGSPDEISPAVPAASSESQPIAISPMLVGQQQQAQQGEAGSQVATPTAAQA